MIAGIIPARYASSRFPGKPLVQIEGKSMIQRVCEQVWQSKLLNKVVVATDDERIARHVRDFGGEVVMTASNHPSGTDRCMEALRRLDGDYRYVVNIQGDEPFLHPEQIDALCESLDGRVEIATQIALVEHEEELFDPGEAKVILNPAFEAIYFSRSPIPYLKDVPQREWHLRRAYYRHIGMYAYRSDILEKLTRLPVSSLEKAESLEQLRWLEAGYKVKCVTTKYESHCIDTPEDIVKVLRIMKERKRREF